MNTLIQKIQSLLPHHKFSLTSTIDSSLPYYLITVILGLACLLYDSHPWFFIALIYSFLPLADEIVSLDVRNPAKNEAVSLEKHNYKFVLPLYVAIIIDWYFFVQLLIYFTTFSFNPQSLLNVIGLIFIFSNLNAVQFAIAHEIFHKAGIINKVFGTLHMSKNLYMHFTYEHLHGHHRRVATPEDVASAEKGITLWPFVVRSYLGSYKSVYVMQQLQRKPFIANYAVLSVAAAVLFTALITYLCGPKVCVLFLISAFGSIFYLEAINYIEHYGLRRKQLPDRSYEKVTILHSWNAPHRFTNYLLFKLQRHSDHHENSMKPYQTLVSLDQSPMMPHGYTLMILMSMFSKVWSAVMDPLVEIEENKTKLSEEQKEAIRQKSMRQSRIFGLQLGVSIIAIWIISELI